MTVTQYATPEQARAALQMLLEGVSSDPASLQNLLESWWKRLFFRYWVGPRMVQKEMDTFVAAPAEDSTDLDGYLIVQYTGETAGTFDWALDRPPGEMDPTDQEIETFAALLAEALDWVEEKGQVPYFYFGLDRRFSPRYVDALKEEGMWLPDYQLVQMTTPLPLMEAPSVPEELNLVSQRPKQFTDRLPEVLRLDYQRSDSAVAVAGKNALEPSEEVFQEDLDAIAALHEATLRNAKIYTIEQDDEVVGFLQQHVWQNTLRLLISLKPELWDTDLERRLVAALPGMLAPDAGTLRLRTFSRNHLETSRARYESLGMAWQEAPWQRWMVGL